MEKVAFIGGYDKTDMLFYIGKLLKTMGKNVLVVDTTVPQKARYIIPTITPTASYITTSDTVDFAIGFGSIKEIEQYMAAEELGFDYDYLLIDIDSKMVYKKFEFAPTDKHYVVTSFDMYSIKKAVKALEGIELKTQATKVYFSRVLSVEEDRYFKFLTKDSNVVFKKEPVFFPIDLADLEEIQKNQRDNVLRYKNLSSKYLYNIIFITEEISGESSSNIKRALRTIDR